VWGRVKAPTTNDNSFWTKMDNGAWISWNNIPISSSWIWDDVHNANNNNTVVTYSLSAGTHVFTIGYREDGTQLDKLYISSTGTTPSGLGGTSYNCSAFRVTKDNDADISIKTIEDNAINNADIGSRIILYPNPVSDQLNISIPNIDNYEDAVIDILNANGNKVQSEPVVEGVNKIDVSALPGGIFSIIVRISDKVLVTKRVVIIE
jgi:hypothetical protein